MKRKEFAKICLIVGFGIFALGVLTGSGSLFVLGLFLIFLGLAALRR